MFNMKNNKKELDGIDSVHWCLRSCSFTDCIVGVVIGEGTVVWMYFSKYEYGILTACLI